MASERSARFISPMMWMLAGTWNSSSSERRDTSGTAKPRPRFSTSASIRGLPDIVGGYVEQLVLGAAVHQRHGNPSAAFVSFDQHQEFAEYLGEVAAVDLVDDEYVVAVRVRAGAVAQAMETPVLQLERARLSRHGA